MSDAWMVTVKIRVRNLVDHGVPNAEALARGVIEEDLLMRLTYPEDCEIVEIVPVKGA